MTADDPERPAQDWPTDWPTPGAVEYPPLDARQPVDYHFEPRLPPPVYAPPPPGYPAAPGYYPAYDPYHPVAAPGTNGNAVASLVTSVAGWLCCAPLAIVGVVLGVIAMRETKRTGQEGWGLALAGTIIGGVFVAAGLVVLVLYIALAVSTL